MNLILRTLIAVIPALLIWSFIRYQLWGTQKKRDIVGFLLGFMWALGFGYFSGITGFLRN